MRKKHIYQTIRTFSFFAFLAVTILPLPLQAQNYWGGKDGELISEWRERSSVINNKIANLDDDRVEDVPLPILFGLTLDNLSRNFSDPRSGGRQHEGLDMMAPRRALVVSPTEAVVIRVGVGDSAGKYVYTANPGKETFAYMHLDEIADIEEGDELSAGDLIGYVGNTGNASGGATHLHFEIRFDQEATDPYPRLTRIFPLKDKIKYLKNILNDADNEKKLAESVVSMYRKELVQAETLKIELPDSITKAMTNIVVETSSISRTLRVGSAGDDVKLLQTALGISADGVFGPRTKAALISFQISKGLTPDGVFGAMSRTALVGKNTTGCTKDTLYSPLTGAKCPTL